MAYTQAGNKKAAFTNFLFYFMTACGIGFGVIVLFVAITLTLAAIVTHPLLALPALVIFVAFTFAADKSFNIYRGSEFS